MIKKNNTKKSSTGEPGKVKKFFFYQTLCVVDSLKNHIFRLDVENKYFPSENFITLIKRDRKIILAQSIVPRKTLICES